MCRAHLCRCRHLVVFTFGGLSSFRNSKRIKYLHFRKKALRTITLSGYLSHTGSLYKENTLLKVDDILIPQQLKLYFKYLNSILPVYLQSWSLIYNAAIHNHDTRTKNELSFYRAKHEFAKKCFRHNLPLTLNNTPSIIKNKLYTPSLQGGGGGGGSRGH